MHTEDTLYVQRLSCVPRTGCQRQSGRKRMLEQQINNNNSQFNNSIQVCSTPTQPLRNSGNAVPTQQARCILGRVVHTCASQPPFPSSCPCRVLRHQQRFRGRFRSHRTSCSAQCSHINVYIADSGCHSTSRASRAGRKPYTSSTKYSAATRDTAPLALTMQPYGGPDIALRAAQVEGRLLQVHPQAAAQQLRQLPFLRLKKRRKP